MDATVSVGTRQARALVRRRMAELHWTAATLSREAGVHISTVENFLAGRRWPRTATIGALESTLGIPAGTVDTMAHLSPQDGSLWPTSDINVTSAESDRLTAQVLIDTPRATLDGFSEAEREEVLTSARLALLAKAREIRAQHDRED